MDDRSVMHGGPNKGEPNHTAEVSMVPPTTGSDKRWDGVERRLGPINPFRVAIIFESELADMTPTNADPEPASAAERLGRPDPGGG
jgi:hypothetical protein